ncbi:ATP-binding cassette domain-containing protein [Aeromonas enteropelogenes]|uniref:ATP-binding cassette domain-containing protein n=1 Tax=Aeromonas enteropelogenes TaxID=29489 RepID=UPI0022867778|nr:ATP-binding cassette domain-containing protein [Aeromonas enteropelogenes]MCZ0753793.1 ATP-binding cassette domain-containing protein [Aeromonas enteropelogenes]
MESSIELKSMEYIGHRHQAPNVVVVARNVLFESGKTTALVGPNGSGKSTLLNALMGFRSDFAMRASFAGHNYADGPPPDRHRIGFTSQSQSFPSGVKVKDLVAFHRRVYGPLGGEIASAVSDLMPTDLLGIPYEKLSGGQKQRVNLYMALGHLPDLALIDEPESSLDDKRTRSIAHSIKARAMLLKTTLVATHDAQILATAENVVLMIAGEVSYQGTLQDLITKRLGQGALEIVMDGEAERQRLMLVLAKNTARKMQIELEDGRLLLFGSSALRDVINEPAFVKKRMGLTWRSVTPKDLLLSLDANCVQC